METDSRHRHTKWFLQLDYPKHHDRTKNNYRPHLVISNVLVWLESQRKSRLLLLLVFIQIAIHAPYLNRPAMGTHVWRQCNTLAVARNYAEEDMRIWLPRIDKRYRFSGTTGPSFTAYEYTLATVYKVFGFSQTHHRYLSLFFSILAIWGMYLLAFSFLQKQVFAFFTSFALLAIPEFYYHSLNAVPDLLALACMIWGWFFTRKWISTPSVANYTLAFLLLGLGGMIKLQFLVVGAPIAVEILSLKANRSQRLLPAIMLAFLVSLVSFAWYKYAHFLTFQYWLQEYVHDIRLPQTVGGFLKVLFQNLASDLPETWVGYGLITGFIAGFIKIWRLKSMRLTALACLAGGIFIYVLLQRQFVHHGYYILFLGPFIALCAAYGYLTLSQSRYKWFLIIFLLAPVWAWLRMAQNWDYNNSRVPNDLLTTAAQNKVIELSDSSKRYIVGPDQSGCIYFYYLHAKGYPWYNEQEKQADLAKWVREGADGLITNRPDLMQQMFSDSLVWQQTGRVGDFIWYDVKLKNP